MNIQDAEMGSNKTVIYDSFIRRIIRKSVLGRNRVSCVEEIVDGLVKFIKRKGPQE